MPGVAGSSPASTTILNAGCTEPRVSHVYPVHERASGVVGDAWARGAGAAWCAASLPLPEVGPDAGDRGDGVVGCGRCSRRIEPVLYREPGR
jgi:hypothetical protein